LNITNIIKISSGAVHSIILNNNGEFYTFGYNNNGALGIGNEATQYSPILNSLLNISDISAGGSVDGSGYFSLVLNTFGQVYSFGYNGVTIFLT
jgi:alpha-tubulin suppressor-like RCC1 family protein